MLAFPATEIRRICMSARALEFVETWVSEKIEQEGVPDEGGESPAKEWATECREAALDDGIPSGEIDEAFDDLAEFMDGQIEEARERDEDEDEDEEEFYEDEEEKEE
jgi:hypothetical protein